MQYQVLWLSFFKQHDLTIYTTWFNINTTTILPAQGVCVVIIKIFVSGKMRTDFMPTFIIEMLTCEKRLYANIWCWRNSRREQIVCKYLVLKGLLMNRYWLLASVWCWTDRRYINSVCQHLALNGKVTTECVQISRHKKKLFDFVRGAMLP